MNIFCDTSSLVKKYIIETGSDKFDKLVNKADNVCVSAITEIETISTFKRLLIEQAIDQKDYDLLINEFEIDYQYYSIIPFDNQIIKNAIKLIDKYQLKTLDSIQLGTAIYIKDEVDSFIVCDEKLINAALKEKIKIINPNK